MSTNSANWQSLVETPDSLKPIQKYIRISNDIERLDPVVAYWIRFHAVEVALKLDRQSLEAKMYMNNVLSLLEKFKQENKSNEKVTQNVVAQANYENFVLSLFNKADSIDRAGDSDMKTVKMFYTVSVLLEALASFGPISEEINEKIKYSRFKSTYILKCLKNGEKPHPGPLNESGQQDPVIDSLPQISTKLNDTFERTQTDDENNKSMKDNKSFQVSDNAGGSRQQQDSGTPKGVQGMKSSELVAINGQPLDIKEVIKAQKCLKYANASLSFNDIKNTVDNLEKALRLLKTGTDQDSDWT